MKRVASILIAAVAFGSTYRTLDDVDLFYHTPFGSYSKAYFDRNQAKRWKRMCNGPERYDAMREAAELKKANPCR